jgi:hypothetical protein
MSATPAARPNGAPRYEIRLQGHLHARWATWFDGLDLTTDDSDGTTTLRGRVIDQAALHGVLQKLRDTGLTLISVTQLHAHQSNDSAHPSARPGRI